MNILENIYNKSVSENERNLCFWEDYLNNLKSLDFNKYGEKLTVPTLVPIGSRILLRGELKHTNELTVAMGADYFAKCSIAQAEILRLHRIKDAQSKVNMFRKEKDYLENQLIFRKQNILDTGGQEIVEEYTEEKEKEWRKKHRENIKHYKTQSKENKQKDSEEITDEELWNRLEELELQEELENELLNMDKDVELSENDKPPDTFITEEDENIPVPEEIIETKQKVTYIQKVLEEKTSLSKFELLQKVIDRQNELGQKLQELKHKERSVIKTENDLISRLDEIEQLDDVEDEMDRLDDIIEGEDEDVDYDEDNEIQKNEDDEFPKAPAPLIKRSVFFADEDDSKTLEITFQQSDNLPSTEPYDSNKGIQKPSDIYSAYQTLFNNETTSILKKSKYIDKNLKDIPSARIEKPPKVSFMLTDEDEHVQNVKTIVVGDIVERTDQNGNMVDNSEARPTSLFKKKRMQKNK